MIKKNPADRFQTPAELVEALKPFTGHAIPLPSAEEMPRVSPSTFRLGLCTAMQPGSGVGRATATASVLSAEVSTAGAVPRKSSPEVKRGAERQPAASQMLEDDLPELSDIGLPPPSLEQLAVAASMTGNNGQAGAATSLAANKKVADANKGSRPTQTATGRAPKSKQQESAIEQSVAALSPDVKMGLDRRSRIILLSGLLAGMLFIGGAMFVLQRISAARERTALTQADPADVLKPVPGVAIPLPPGEGAPAAVPASGVILRGGGSTFVKPIVEHWAKLYQKKTGVKIEYTAVGSSKGIDGVTSKFLDFGCTDAFMSEKQLADAGGPMIHIPLVMGAVVATYNVSDQSGKLSDLRFTGPVLANIYLGKIKKWNDPAIAYNNPDVQLPDLDIVVVYRKEGSGTTSIWTDYLSKASADWKSKVGMGTKVEWPVGVPAEKSDGVADMVSRTAGAIGYVELGFALGNGLPVGQVKNKAGAFVTPSIEAITAAASGSLHNIPDDLRYSLTDAPGQTSYPIVGTAWAVLFIDQPAAKGKELVNFFRWATGEGQQHVASLKYGSLPPELVEKIHGALDGVLGAK
jgi:phosphate ABC transporter phosphate-binding protein